MTCLNSNAGGTRWCAEQQALPMAPQGRVMRSRRSNPAIASAAFWPHMSGVGRRELHTAGRSGRPNKRQRNCSSSCTHGTPAGLPSGMPGMGELIDGAMQQAAQWGRQCIGRRGAAPLRQIATACARIQAARASSLKSSAASASMVITQSWSVARNA